MLNRPFLLSNRTVPGWTGDPKITSTLIKYDMAGNVWTNNTGPDAIGRAEGVMVYLPASDQGNITSSGLIVRSKFAHEHARATHLLWRNTGSL